MARKIIVTFTPVNVLDPTDRFALSIIGIRYPEIAKSRREIVRDLQRWGFAHVWDHQRCLVGTLKGVNYP